MGDTLFQEFIEVNNEINAEFGYPVFIWQGNNYNCIPNSYRVSRELEEGGFVSDLMLEIIVNRYDVWTDSPVFPGDVIPAPQQTLQYNGNTFRIQAVMNSPVFDHQDGSQTSPNGATIKIYGICPFRGV